MIYPRYSNKYFATAPILGSRIYCTSPISQLVPQILFERVMHAVVGTTTTRATLTTSATYFLFLRTYSSRPLTGQTPEPVPRIHVRMISLF